ncbi:hypothetical protein MNBD_ACTINO02-2609, partial [hydrothermal vent metagenome]
MAVYLTVSTIVVPTETACPTMVPVAVAGGNRIRGDITARARPLEVLVCGLISSNRGYPDEESGNDESRTTRSIRNLQHLRPFAVPLHIVRHGCFVPANILQEGALSRDARGRRVCP